ncbi:MAG: Omp28-related outer membrane protein, partial [Bacteroidota bacterium]
IEGNTMSIRTRTKFFQPGQGDYHLSVFVLEDGIDGSDGAPQGYEQTGGGNDYTHNCVWRASATSEIMGELIATDPAADSKVNKNYTVQLDPKWKDVYPVAVIWKHDDQASVKFKYVNSIRKK